MEGGVGVYFGLFSGGGEETSGQFYTQRRAPRRMRRVRKGIKTSGLIKRERERNSWEKSRVDRQEIGNGQRRGK